MLERLTHPGMSFDATVLGALELATFAHWVDWLYEQRPGEPKPRKVPKNAHTGANASTTDPSSWASFADAVRRAEREGWGVGFVFHAVLNPFAGIDLDGCRDPHSGVLASWAESIVAAFDSYTEVSPSGTGVKIIVHGKPAHNGKKPGTGGTAVETYGEKRYFALTGCAL